uniref:Uncharacterized protein n=1 Tax=Anguilla anguilla TaxID=7936 RepID=A0A0E9VN97_ANGAN
MQYNRGRNIQPNGISTDN